MKATLINYATIIKNNSHNASGNIIEWYDFSLYLLFTPIIAKHFFPNQHHSVTLTLLIFALGMLARPLGGILFGWLGDHYTPRKAMRLSILCINMATIAVGLLPGISILGQSAAILLLVLRVVQGISAGGQFSGSINLLLSRSNVKQQATSCSVAHVMSTFGYLLAALVCWLLTLCFTKISVYTYAWRLPFLLSAVFLFLPAGSCQQKATSPTTNTKVEQSYLTVLQQNRRPLLYSTALALVGAGLYYAIFTFPVILLSHFLHYTLSSLFLMQTLCLILSCLSTPWLAQLSDRVSIRTVLIASSLAIAILATPSAMILQWHDIVATYATVCLLVILNTTFITAVTVYYVALFPAQIRYSGSAISYNIGNAILGGFTPMLLAWLIQTTHNPTVYGIFLALIGAIGTIIGVKLKHLTLYN